jgi:cytosine/adenosine deaminase-related metal-dependent hydrolase
MRATGTVLVGDVSNGLTTAPAIRSGGLGGVVFHELLGFAAGDPAETVRQAWGRVRIAEALLPGRGHRPDAEGPDAPESIPIDFSVVAHAPYSVSPALFREIVHRANDALLTVHLAESPEEIELLSSGRGPLRTLLEDLGLWTGGWTVPRTDPARYLAELGYLRPGVLVVHGVYLSDDGLDRLRRAGAVLVTCPRSNTWVGAGPPRLSHFYASGVPVAIGTDSLASSSSLNMFDELAEMRRIAPDVAAASMLESATRVGAAALGFADDFGTIAAGKRARFVIVDVPDDVRDVEEYLVSGVPAHRVRAAA